MDYEGKKILAPMVRVGTLPFRLLAAEYGADITYGEEIVDHRMLKCTRIENDLLGTTDFVEKGTNFIVFRTCEEERQRVVFQMGTADATRALRVAELVCKDVAVVDVNMGCPKAFSLQGGMGAALLSNPERIHDIMTTLRRNLTVPVSCKIRLLSTPEATVDLARAIERMGVTALAVHGREVSDRPKDPARWDWIRTVADSLSIPVIANGDVFEYADFARMREATGAAGVMVARGALWNASVFREEGPLPWEEVKRAYVRKSVLWDNELKLTKYTVKEMISHHSCLEGPEGKAVVACQNFQDVSDLYGQREYFDTVMATRVKRAATLGIEMRAPSSSALKRKKRPCDASAADDCSRPINGVTLA